MVETGKDWTGRWDYQLGGPPDNECGCWDCLVMAVPEGSMKCQEHCIVCRYPDATIENCLTCDAMTWHDGRCLCCDLGGSHEYGR